MTLSPECDDGNIEYKRHLYNIKGIKLEKLVSQMQFRMREGNGCCIYFLGVNDNGSIYNMTNLEKIETIENILLVITKLNYTLTKFEKEENYYKIHISDPSIDSKFFFI
jgi:GTPase